MQWNFGTGLSYTTFSYSNMTLSKTNVTGEGDSVTASVTVTNSGMRSGKETVMLFLTQPFRALSLPEVKALKAFEKIELAPKESKTVSFTLTHNDWGVYKPQIGKGFLRVAEPGEFVVAFKPETNCDVYNATAVVDLCAKFNLV
jgi:beta-glucosidase